MLLEAHNIKKVFPKKRPLYTHVLFHFGQRERITALNGVDLYMCPGEILGLVGQNGAGKTTLLRILAGIIEPDAGDVKIFGESVSKAAPRIRRMIGYVSSDERSFFWRLSGRDNLRFFGRLYGLPHGQARKRTSKLLRQFDFEKRADSLFRDYSAGMRKKVSVMRAMLHQPALLLLDEVTNSLDPNSVEMVKNMVRQYVSSKANRAAIWSTHRLEEVSQICDKVVMIQQGRIVSASTVEKTAGKEETYYLLKTDGLNGGFDAFCQKIPAKTKVTADSKNGINEFVFNGVDQSEFSEIVSMAVKDFGAYVIFAGCVKRNPDKLLEQFANGE